MALVYSKTLPSLTCVYKISYRYRLVAQIINEQVLRPQETEGLSWLKMLYHDLMIFMAIYYASVTLTVAAARNKMCRYPRVPQSHVT